MLHRRLIAVVSALALSALAVGFFGQAGASSSALATKIQFVGPRDGGGEPSIATGQRKWFYVSYPGTKENFYRSTDGVTWEKGAYPPDANSVGDTSVFTDRSGAVYQTDLHVAETGTPQNSLQVSVYKSLTHGKKWSTAGSSTLESSNSSGQPFFVDRQWNDAWIPPGKNTNQAVVGLSYHDFVPSQIWVSMSMDGGKTFGTPVDAITDPNATADSFCSTIPGGLRINPAKQHQGRIYVAWLASDPANPATGCNVTQLQSFHDVWIAWSDDMGKTWTDKLVYDAGPLKDGSEIFADLALDNKGNPYVAFTMDIGKQFDVYVEGSTDGGMTWNTSTKGKPVKVDSGKGSHYFPAIDVGKPGHVDVAYIATPTVVTTQADGKPDEPTADAKANWYVYLAQTTNMFGGQAFHNLELSSRSIHHGDVCTLGIFCSSNPSLNRDLLDFIDVVIDHNGMAHVAFTAADGKMKEGIYVANQISGPSAGSPGH